MIVNMTTEEIQTFAKSLTALVLVELVEEFPVALDRLQRKPGWPEFFDHLVERVEEALFRRLGA